MTSTARFEMYATIHKAVRAWLCDVLTAVGAMDADDAAERAHVLGRARDLLRGLRQHLHHENQFLHPAMDARVPGSACRTAHDHVEHEAAIERCEALVCGVEQAGNTAARAAAAAALYRRLALLAAENFEHMHIEETDNQAALWAAYDDAELVALHDALVASLTPQEMQDCLRWMLPWVNPAERIGMLTGMRAGMPPEAFDDVLAMLRPLLSAREQQRLAAAFGERSRPVGLAEAA